MHSNQPYAVNYQVFTHFIHHYIIIGIFYQVWGLVWDHKILRKGRILFILEIPCIYFFFFYRGKECRKYINMIQ